MWSRDCCSNVWVVMSAMNACAGKCQCGAMATKWPGSTTAALRVARSLALPLVLFGEQAAPAARLKLARWPLQLGAARIVSSGGGFRALHPSSQKRQQHRIPSRSIGVVNKLPSPHGPSWLSGQDSRFWQLQVRKPLFSFKLCQ